MSTEYYAYQIALKTLKERCDYLQNKLDSTEEENCKLKLQVSEDMVKSSSRGIMDADQLRLQISLLVEQKAKLNRQVQLVTIENQNLWSRLSKFTSNNDNFESKVSFKEDPLKYLEGNVSYSDSHSDLDMTKVAISPDGDRESLEEISLKLNALISEKRVLPNEFPSTLDLFVYKNTLPMENCAFSSDGNASVLSSVKSHIIKLKQFKQILQNNKNDLTSAVTILKNIQKNNLCPECEKTFALNCDANSGVLDQINDLPTLQVHEVGLEANESQVPDKMCPLCGATFSGSFQEFQQHVSDHFSDEEHEIAHTFEMVP